MGGGRDKPKKPNLDEQTLRIAERMLHTPPRPHDDMKLGKGKPNPIPKPISETKMRAASKGRVHKGRTRT